MEYEDDLKALALRYVEEKFPEMLANNDAESAALIMEVFIDGYNSERL